jgi:hypothetical protein
VLDDRRLDAVERLEFKRRRLLSAGVSLILIA